MLPSPRRLIPHLSASYGGAALDNLFQFAAGAALTTLAYARLSDPAAADTLARDFVSYALALFMLPTVLLAPLAGDLGDRVPKQVIFRWARVIDVLVCALGTLGIWLVAPWLILSALFLLGCTTAFFSPVKYSSIPDLVDPDRLPAANAWVQAVTIIAIVTGMAFGGLCDPALHAWITGHLGVSIEVHPALVIGGVSAVLCTIGIAGAFTMPDLPARRPGTPLRPFAFFDQARAFALPGVLVPALSLCGFWALGAATKTLIQPVAFGVWKMGEVVQAGLFLSIACGIAVGAAITPTLMARAFPAGLPVIGGIIAGGALLAAGFTAHLASQDVATVSQLWLLAGMLMLCGIGSGMWEVPLQVFVQERSPPEQRNRVLAAANLTSNVAIIFAALAVGPGASAIGMKSPEVMALVGGISLALALGALWLYRGQVLCWAASLLVRLLFRIEVSGTEHLPKSGGCLVASNHLSLADGVILAAVLPRRTKFMVFKAYCDMPIVGHGLHAWGVIPVDARMGARNLLAAVETATAEAKAGGVVGIFPEGKLSRSGVLDSFKPGIERIAANAGVPIVPCAISGLWRTPWSFAQRKSWWPLLRIPVQVKLAAPLPPETPASELRQAVCSLKSDLAIQRAQLETRTLGSIALARCKWKGHESAVIDAGGTLPRWQLAALATALRPRLQLAKDERCVGVLLPPGRGGSIVNLCLALAGRTSVNLNHTAGPVQLKRMCEMAGVRTIISAAPYLKRIGGDPGLPVRMLMVEDILKAIPKAVVLWQFALTLLMPARWRDQGRPHDVAALVFSSGSTGDPKGVQLTHAQILANNDSIRRALDVGPGDVVLTPLPLFHSFGLVPGMWLGLESGFAIAAHPDPMDAKGLGELAAKAGATFSIGTATFVRGWLRRIEPDKFKNLRFAVAAAEKCPKELRDAFKEKYHADLLEGYGCTELAPAVCFNMQTVVNRGETEVRSRDGTVGRALPGQHVFATDRETRAILPTGQEGLLVVRTPARMLGYLGRDDLTAKAFLHGGYDTGDIGVVDADGYIRITGRLARFAKIGGEMVPLDTVEAAVQAAHADVCEIAVAAVPDPDRGERLVVLVAGENPPPAEAIVAGAAQLAPLWRPKAKDVHRIDAMPRLGTGKRDLAGVKKLAAEKAGPA